MLSFRTAEEAPLDAFLSVSAASPFQPRLREYADSLLERRSTRPGWCVIGFESDVPVARAALWALPDEAVPTDVVLIDTDWDEPDLAGGQALLGRVHELAAALGATQLHHHVDSPPGPPQYQEDEAARTRLLTEAGYGLLRDGLRWVYRTSREQASAPELSLAFRGLRDVGEDAFVEAVAATYEGTRDSWLMQNIGERGLLGAARADFLDYQQMEYQPEWWELAYTHEGALAGVIMPARNPSSAVVAYVGVVPEQRGRGLAVPLVRRGTEQLAASGAAEIRGDCDRDNVAMVKAFQRAGYEQFARRRSYQYTLT
jgi:ribosomal protein S18 acetylase RimI-like enzyme